MSDLIERLEDEALCLSRRAFDSQAAGMSANLAREAADRIEALETALREARTFIEPTIETANEFETEWDTMARDWLARIDALLTGGDK